MVRSFYVRYIRAHLSGIQRQRVKLFVFGWAYWRIFAFDNLNLANKLRLLQRFLTIDWSVPHAHRPSDIVSVCEILTKRPAHPGEIVIEAGCWQGGGSCKLSIVCALLGYVLCIYDSFEGVEKVGSESPSDYDFSGQYAATEQIVRGHIEKFGEIQVTQLHKGWFIDTLAKGIPPNPVRLTYIDCDLAKGTMEVLQAVIPSLAADGVVFSQDYHIVSVRHLLHDGRTWQQLGIAPPNITKYRDRLIRMDFSHPSLATL